MARRRGFLLAFCCGIAVALFGGGLFIGLSGGEGRIDAFPFKPAPGFQARLPDPARLTNDQRRARLLRWAVSDGPADLKAAWVATLLSHPDPWERERAAASYPRQHSAPVRADGAEDAAATNGDAIDNGVAGASAPRFQPHPAALDAFLEAREREQDPRVRRLLLEGISAALAGTGSMDDKTAAGVLDELLATPESDGRGVSSDWAQVVTVLAKRAGAAGRFDAAWEAIWPAREGPLQPHEQVLLETLAVTPSDHERLIIALAELVKATPDPTQQLQRAEALAPLIAKAGNPALAVATLLGLAQPGRPPYLARKAATLLLQGLEGCTSHGCNVAREAHGADLKDMIEPKLAAYERVPRRVADAMGQGRLPWNERELMTADGIAREGSRYMVPLTDGRRVDVLKPLADRIACRIQQCNLTYAGHDSELGYFVFVAHVPGGGAQRYVVDKTGGDTLALEAGETIAQAHAKRWRDAERAIRTPFASRERYTLAITLADGRVARFIDDTRCGERCTRYQLTGFDPELERYEIAYLSAFQAQRLSFDRTTGMLTCRRQGRDEKVTCPAQALSGLPQPLEQ